MDRAEKEQILQDYDRAIRAAVNRVANFRSRHRIREAAEDCLQYARMECWKALDRYDSDRSSLKTFIFTRARLSAIDYVRQHGHFTQGGRRTGRYDCVMSISAKLAENAWTDVTIEDVTPDRDYTPARKQSIDAEDLISLACGSYRAILRRYFIDGRKMREIGEEMGLSESRVSQLVSEGLATLKGPISQEIHVRGKIPFGGNGDAQHGTD